MTAPSTYTRPSLNKVAVPIVGEFLLGMTVGMAGLFLASSISDTAAGSFGFTQQVLEALFVLFRVLAIGLGIVVTQLIGSGQADKVKQTAFLSLGASTWAGLAVAAWLVFGDQLTLDALNAPAVVSDMAGIYMLLLAPAMVLEAYNLSMAAVLRAHLFARESLLIMVAMHGSHLLLAIPLMRGVAGVWDGMGINGFAVAWLLSRGLGLWLHLFTWKMRMALVPEKADWWRLPLGALWPVLRIGVPGAALELFYRVNFLVSVSAVARHGVEALATHSYVLQTLKYVLLISMAIGWANEIMVGRMVGAGQLRQADQLLRKSVRNGLLASGLLAVSAALFAPWIMQMFTKDPAIIRAAQWLLFMSIALELGRVYNLVVIGSLRASGDIHFPFLASVASLIVILGLGSYLMGRMWGLPGIWLAYVADECLRGWLMWQRWKTFGWAPKARLTYRRLQGKAGE